MKTLDFDQRACGILMPIFSLPSKYGIGSFGSPSYNFIDFLHESKQSYWQILPLNPTAYMDSPYQSPGSLVGNPYFIDLTQLKDENLISEEELNEAETEEGSKIDYGKLFYGRFKLLRSAYSRFIDNEILDSYIKENNERIFSYALFMSIKIEKKYSDWAEWEEELKCYEKAKNNAWKYAEEMRFWYFTQYLFDEQYSKLKAYANAKNVAIIGDIPFYVAYESADCWSNASCFSLKEDFTPDIVAGCPPDGFTPDGQLWGNPVYSIENMRNDSFAFWRKRIEYGLKTYDCLRLDHFCGMVKFFGIPYGEKTTHNGKWYDSFGNELFALLSEQHSPLPVIAEDLGYFEQNADKLREKYGIAGMKLLQSAFWDDISDFLPSRFTSENCVVYTGNHDSDTLLSWCNNLSGKMKSRFYKEVKPKKKEAARLALIRVAMESKAKLAIIPLQDYMGLSNQARINTPGTAIGNWTWRLDKLPDSRFAEYLSSIAKKYNRNPR